MFLRIASIIASILVLFMSAPAMPESPRMLVETLEGLSEYRTADEINGVGETRFYIQRPDGDKLNEVNASVFGLSESNEDNFDAFQAALDYCALYPQTKLVIDNGTYYFRSEKGLDANNCTDLLIEGNDATFIFSSTGYKFFIRNSDCVEIRNLNFDWNWAESPLASVVTVQNSNTDTHTLELVFKNAEYCDESLRMRAITQCDPETYTFGTKYSSKENYLYQDTAAIKGVEKISDNTLRVTHSGCLDSFEDGEVYILRHYVYDGTVFNIRDYSKNTTFDDVNIYGSSGMAYICEGNCSHFQIINSFIGVNPEDKDKRCVSLTADAIHIVNTDGCFNVSGCDISGMGDDAINVHDGLGYVSSVNGNTLTLIASAMRLSVGDVLAFKNTKFENTDLTAKIISVRPLEGIIQEVVVEALPEGVTEGFTAYSMECDSSNYVIRNNYFHENRARGLLLQSSNGLCENNRFYKTMAQAIKVVMDIEPTLWQEGTGVDNLVIRNNSFEKCNYSDWGSVIEIGTNVAGKSAETAVFTNIEIISNTFTDIPSTLLRTNNVNGLAFRDNTIQAGEFFDSNMQQGRTEFGEFCSNVTYTDNDFADSGFLRIREIVKSENIRVWAQINSQN
ncbi:MAG: right-handed parallel beta-helix repeat-containing protein [Clostridia bacterium]|nr:right-handed parallel beta-helix repeat-containing protein [Clostridia bacterium]